MLERVDRIDQNLLINGLVKPLCQRLPGGVATMSNVFLYQIIDRFMGRYQGNFNASPTWEVLSDDSLMKGDFIDANGSLELQQRVESLLAVSLAGEKASVSMELYSESCNQITLSLYYPLIEDDWTSEQVITSETFDIPVNEEYSLKWENIDMGYNVRNGAQLRVKFHNAQTLGAVTEHKVKKIKLSVGEKAQAWSPCGRNLIEDQSLCQRYLYKRLPENFKAVGLTYGSSILRFSAVLRQAYPRTMRISPAISNLSIYVSGPNDVTSLFLDYDSTDDLFQYRNSVSDLPNEGDIWFEFEADAEL